MIATRSFVGPVTLNVVQMPFFPLPAFMRMVTTIFTILVIKCERLSGVKEVSIPGFIIFTVRRGGWGNCRRGGILFRRN